MYLHKLLETAIIESLALFSLLPIQIISMQVFYAGSTDMLTLVVRPAVCLSAAFKVAAPFSFLVFIYKKYNDFHFTLI